MCEFQNQTETVLDNAQIKNIQKVLKKHVASKNEQRISGYVPGYKVTSEMLCKKNGRKRGNSESSTGSEEENPTKKRKDEDFELS